MAFAMMGSNVAETHITTCTVLEMPTHEPIDLITEYALNPLLVEVRKNRLTWETGFPRNAENTKPRTQLSFWGSLSL